MSRRFAASSAEPKSKHAPAALLQRWRRDKVTMGSRNIIRPEIFHLFRGEAEENRPAEQVHAVIQGERT